MNGPLIEVLAVTKDHGGARPLRLRSLRLGGSDRIALAGLDMAAAETLLHLITGASLPDTGTLRVSGRDTREIATDTEWLASLDQFGIVTRRAVLIEALPINQNLALPLTLSIDPMSDDVRTTVEALADAVGLGRDRIAAPAATLSPTDLIRVHLARALAARPRMLLLEHPTATLGDPASRAEFGRVLRNAAGTNGLGWLALTDDSTFAKASGSRRLRLKPETGEVVPEGSWWRRFAT